MPLCPHCNFSVADSTYRKHEKKFYDAVTNTWTTVSEMCQPLSPVKKRPRIISGDLAQLSGSLCETSPFHEVATMPVPKNNTTKAMADCFSLTSKRNVKIDPLRKNICKETQPQKSFKIEVGKSVDGRSEGNSITDGMEELGSEDEIHAEVSAAVQEQIPYEMTQSAVHGGTPSELISSLLYCLLLWQTKNKISNLALQKLLATLSEWVKKIGENNDFMKIIGGLFPGSTYLMKKWVNINQNNFRRYIVCPKCATISELASTFYTDKDGLPCPIKCKHTSHYANKSNSVCSEILVNKVTLAGGKFRYDPKKVYCYRSLASTFSCLLARVGIEEQCEVWRKRSIPSNYYADIYDGKVWKTFTDAKNMNFFSQSNCYGLMLNVDWFQPFDRRSDVSLGVLYLTLLNLPRTVRYKRENVIIVGIIPALGFTAPLNSFLEPLVKELNEFWDPGQILNTYQHPDGVLVRAALISAAADIPATRKLCGFLNYNAKLGCSKCLKEFPGGFGKTNYSGFDKDQWPKRSNGGHRNKVRQVLLAKNKTQESELRSKLGCWYSTLIELPYFDIVRYHTIDPMHNLYLGTAKNVWRLWVDGDNPILSKENQAKVSLRIGKMKVPCKSGWIPSAIQSNWSSFNAHEWMEWTMIYSMYALYSLLPDDHYSMWQTYVLACIKITRPIITDNDAMIADVLFQKFGREFEKCFGCEKVTPNMHLHCHLLECIRDYGSIYSFWLFAFERYNGLLGSMPNNKKNVAEQFMKQFLVLSEVYKKLTIKPLENMELLLPYLFSSDILEQTDTIQNIIIPEKVTLPRDTKIWTNIDNIKFPKSERAVYLKKDQNLCKCLLEMYRVLYGDEILFEDLGLAYWQMSNLQVSGDRHGSKLYCKTDRLSYVMAHWCGADGQISTTAKLRLGLIRCFMKHSVKVSGVFYVHILALVEWFHDLPVGFHLVKPPLSVWCWDKYFRGVPSVFIPIQRIKCKAAVAVDEVANMKCLIVSPVYSRVFL